MTLAPARQALPLLVALWLSACPPPPSQLVSIMVTPGTARVPRGATLQLVATGRYADGSARVLTSDVAWSADDQWVAALAGDPGVVTGLNPGTTTVRVRLDGVGGDRQVLVTEPTVTRLELDPPQPVVAVPLGLQLHAVAVLTDQTTREVTGEALWALGGGSGAVALAADQPGHVTAVAVGTAQVVVSWQGASAQVAVTVTGARVRSLDVAPASSTLPVGATRRLTATATLNDGSTLDVTADAAWTTGSPALARVSSARGHQGEVTGLAAGTAVVTASLQGQQAAAQVTVVDAALQRLELSPPALSLAAGTSGALTATAVYGDGTRLDVTPLAGWTSSDDAVAPVSAQGVVRGVRPGVAEVAAAFATARATAPVAVSAAQLRSLVVTPPQATLPLGTRLQLAATGTFTDGTTQDLTGQVAWSASQPAVASVSNLPGSNGLVTAHDVGPTTVAAAFGALEASVTLTVSAAALAHLELAPGEPTVPAGFGLDLTLTGVFTDGSRQDLSGVAAWETSAPAVFSVSNAPGSAGHLTALAEGQGTARATTGGKTIATLVQVSAARLMSVAVAPQGLTLPVGARARLRATGVFSDGTTSDLTAQASWSSSDAAVVGVANAPVPGEASALAVGRATVTAAVGALAGSAAVQVSAAQVVALELAPAAASLPVGLTRAWLATARYSDGTSGDVTQQASWSTDDPAVALVSNAAGARGAVTARAVGATTLRAALGASQASAAVTVTGAALQRLDVSPAVARIAARTWQPFTARGVWSDGTTQDLTAQVTWASSDPSVAAIANAGAGRGRATGVAPGAASITAAWSGVTGAAALTVTGATLVSLELAPPAPAVAAGLTLQLQATGHFSDASTQALTDLVAWSSSDAAVALVSNAVGTEGLARGLAAGGAVVSAAALGCSAQLTLTVTPPLLVGLSLSPAVASSPAGASRRFVATGSFSDGSAADVSERALWTSSDGAVASVSNAAGTRGLAAARAPGQVTLSATASGLMALATFTVAPPALVSVAVTPAAPSLPRGLTLPLQATGTFTDGSTQDLTAQASWSSSAPAVSVSGAGLAQGQAVGSATVTATVGGLSGSTVVTVTPAQLVAIDLRPAAPALALGQTVQLAATGRYTDGTALDLTALATWTAAPGAVAVTAQGLCSALQVGAGAVAASYGGLTGSTVVTVGPAVLVALQVSPPNPSVPAGVTRPLSATGVYSDATTRDLTAQVSWSSADATVAGVSNAAGSQGLVTALRVGTVLVTASLGSVAGTTSVTVSPALLTAVQVTPANASRPLGLAQQFAATGVYSDGSTQVLTATANWSSDAPTVLTVSNAAGSEGLGSSHAPGAVRVTATLGGVAGSTPFTVTPALLTGLTMTPALVNAPLGAVRQLDVAGLYTDGTSQPLTTQASWAVGNLLVASVSNAPGSQGLVTTLGTGATTVTASYRGFSASAFVVVSQVQLAAIDIVPANGSTALGYTRQLIAVGTYTDGTTQLLTGQVTWSSSDPALAFVSNAAGSRGLLSTVAQGTVLVTATLGAISGSTLHTVTAAALVGLAITPASLTLAPGATAALRATGVFSDGSSQDLTAAVTWTSTNPGVAQVSNAPGSQGLATALASGTAALRATSGAVMGQAQLTVP